MPAPSWFVDAPGLIARYRRAVTEAAVLVADHRLTTGEAPENAVDLVLTCPREASTL